MSLKAPQRTWLTPSLPVRLYLFPGIIVLFLSGCQSLNTEYGTIKRASESLQGMVIFKESLEQFFTTRPTYVLSDRLSEDRFQALIHIDRDGTFPSQESITWIQDWLRAEPNRTAVLVLRDGSIASQLCLDWAEQAQEESDATEDQTKKARLREMAGNLRLRSQQESEQAHLNRLDQQGFLVPDQLKITSHWHGNSLEAIAGPLAEGCQGVPRFLQPRLNITLQGEGQPLLSTINHQEELKHIAVEVPVRHSRLVVLSTGTPLLDGSMPDQANARILQNFVNYIGDTTGHDQPKPSLAWVRRLRVGSEAESNMNLLAIVFTKAPISYVIWHLTALLIIFLLWKNRWLGRREDPPRTARQHFMKHIDVLAEHLAADQSSRVAAQAIAEYHGIRKKAPAGQDEATNRA
jgi:hypothetical protein